MQKFQYTFLSSVNSEESEQPALSLQSEGGLQLQLKAQSIMMMFIFTSKEPQKKSSIAQNIGSSKKEESPISNQLRKMNFWEKSKIWPLLHSE